jgi:peptidyl-prolyl cis-trans isomerase D
MEFDLTIVAQKSSFGTLPDKVFTEATKFEMEAADKDFDKVAKEDGCCCAAPVTVNTMHKKILDCLGNQGY